MLINFYNQNGKNYLFHAPDAPAPKEVKGNNPEKATDTGKPDYKEKKDRDNLYKQVESTIAKLKQSPDKKNWETAKDLEHSLNMAKQNDKMKMVSPEVAASSLHDRLDAILGYKVAGASGEYITFDTDTIKGKTPEKPAVAAVKGPKEKPGTMTLEEDIIKPLSPAARKAAGAAALNDAKGFGMVGLLKEEQAAAAPVVEGPKVAPETKLATFVDIKPAPTKFENVYNLPKDVQATVKRFIGSDNALGFSGDKYVKSSNGEIYRAKITAATGDKGAMTEWKKVA